MIVNILFVIGEKVTHVCDIDKKEMIVTGIMIRENIAVYYCSNENEENAFYSCELEKVDRGQKAGKLISIERLIRMEYKQYERLLKTMSKGEIKDVLNMLVNGEEYEMAEVTKRYLERL